MIVIAHRNHRAPEGTVVAAVEAWSDRAAFEVGDPAVLVVSAKDHGSRGGAGIRGASKPDIPDRRTNHRIDVNGSIVISPRIEGEVHFRIAAEAGSVIIKASGQVELAVSRPNLHGFLTSPGAIDVMFDEKEVGEGVCRRVVCQARIVEKDDPLAAGDAPLQGEGRLARDHCLGAGRCR